MLMTTACIASFMLTSCGPRPPVIHAKSDTIIEFVGDKEGTRNEQTDTNAYGLKKIHSGAGALLPEYYDPYQPLAEEFVLSKGDVLEISIFGDAETVVNEVEIAPDGRLYYMFIPGILAEGRTIGALRQELQSAVSEYFVNPEVSILPRQVSGQSFVILGKVRAPGVYRLIGSETIRQAIGNAGGIKVGGFAGTTINIANLRESFIIRDGVKLDVDFEKLVHTDGYDQNIYIQPGDFINIASSLIHEIFLIGDVREPKPIQYKDGLTLSALMAGVAGTVEGWTDRAWVTRVLIVRGSLDDPVTYEINFKDVLYGRARDVYLMPGDIVYVQKKWLGFGRELVRLAIETFFRSFGASAGFHYAKDHWFELDEDDDQ